MKITISQFNGKLYLLYIMLLSTPSLSQTVFPSKLGELQIDVCGKILSNKNYIQEKYQIPPEIKINRLKTDSVRISYYVVTSLLSDNFSYGKKSFKRRLWLSFSNNKLYEQQLRLQYSNSQYNDMLSDYKILVAMVKPSYKYYFASVSKSSNGDIIGKGTYFSNLQSIQDYKESLWVKYEIDFESKINPFTNKFENTSNIEGYTIRITHENYSIANFKRY